METLIELANQYRKEMGMSLDWHTTWGEIFVGDYGSALSETVLVSRNYWFIQRLVENDKVNLYITPLEWIEDLDKYNQEDKLLMTLSISDTPIDDLLLYLK